MENYEKAINLKTIWLMFKRRFDLIILFFCSIALATFLATTFMVTKTYQSGATITKNNAISETNYQVISRYVKDSEVVTTTANNLKKGDVKHSNGKDITPEEILSGISLSSYTANAVDFKLYFQSTDRSITMDVTNELAVVSIQKLKSVDEGQFSSLTVTTAAVDGVKNSKDTRYLIIGLAVGAVFALGAAFIDEIVSDEVYDEKDLAYLGCKGFVLDTNNKVRK